MTRSILLSTRKTIAPSQRSAVPNDLTRTTILTAARAAGAATGARVTVAGRAEVINKAVMRAITNLPVRQKHQLRMRRSKAIKNSALIFLWIALSFPGHSAANPVDTPGKFIKAYGPQIRARLKKSLAEADVAYPPKAVRLAVFKAERRAELWLPDRHGTWVHVKDYAFSATSGTQGPKVYFADLQIPEGIYTVDSLALSEQYHLALHLNHPNEYDMAMLELEGRDPAFMSTGIYVHGGAVSYGCVVIGNRNIEEVFLLSYVAGQGNTSVYIFPHDTNRRRPGFRNCTGCPVWYGDLLLRLSRVIREFER